MEAADSVFFAMYYTFFVDVVIWNPVLIRLVEHNAWEKKSLWIDDARRHCVTTDSFIYGDLY